MHSNMIIENDDFDWLGNQVKSNWLPLHVIMMVKCKILVLSCLLPFKSVVTSNIEILNDNVEIKRPFSYSCLSNQEPLSINDNNDIDNPFSLPLILSKDKKEKEKVKNNEKYLFDENFKIIEDYFSTSQSNTIPLEISKIISDYIINDSLHYIYSEIIKNLNASSDDLIFESPHFLSDLVRIISNNESVINFNAIEHDLRRIIFKWIIHAKKAFKQENDFDAFLQGIKSDYEYLERVIGNGLIIKFQNLKSDYSLLNAIGTDHEGLLLLEIFERGNDIITLYDKVIRNFYHESFTCQMIIKEYFNGHFNNDFVLKAMIFKYDTNEGIIQCFDNPYYLYPSLHQEGDNDNVQPSIKLKLFSRFNSGRNLVNLQVIDFYRDNKARFQVSTCNNLYILLHNLKMISFLSHDVIENFIGFPNDWDQKKFNDLLEEGKRWWPVEYKEYLNLLSKP